MYQMKRFTSRLGVASWLIWVPIPIFRIHQLRIFAVFIFMAAATLHAAPVSQLRCEGRDEPLGIDVAKPRLSWKLESGKQTAYQIVVDGLWDSGRVESDQSVAIEYGGKPLQSSQRISWKVRVWPDGEWSQPSSWTMGLLAADDWKAKWIGAPAGVVNTRKFRSYHATEATSPDTLKSAPKYSTVMLRRGFTVKPGLRRALVHLCGLGEYELTLNGGKVGNDLFPSGWTKYDKTCLYDTHEITAALHSGSNDVTLLLGNGMYNVTFGRYTKFTGSFGPPKAIALMRLDYDDGTTEFIGTDEQWQVSPGPITFCSVYGGEDFDARWKPQWQPAQITAGPGGALKGLSCAAPPIRAFDVLKPVKLANNVFDLGQNASMMPRLTVKGPAGSVVKIVPAELLKASGELDDPICGGQGYWTYTLSGSGVETVFPKFYYRGARYLRVECSGGAEVTALEGIVVHSSAAPVGEFRCSNDLFNRTRTLVRWAQRSNLMSVISDCPHREKLGWLEQYHLNGPSLRYEFDLATLFTKGMNDMADSQLPNGLVPDIAPEYVKFGGGFRDSPEWGSSVVLVPWQQYQFAGDLPLLRQTYDAMQRYVAYLGSKAKDHIVDYGLGDWYDIGPKSPGVSQLTPKALTATAIYYEDVTVLAKTAKLIGRDEDAYRYDALAGQIRTAFQTKFPQLPDSQTGRAMPLVLGLVDPAQRPAVLDALVGDVRQKGLTAGDVGYRYLLRALADGGRSEVVFALNNQSEKPGYGYQLKQGATSLTEAWNAGRGSSQNHLMLGQIIEWFYHDLAGIQPGQPGFKQVIIKPAIVGDLTWVKCSYESPYGKIRSDWQREGNRLTMDVTIPANATATIHVPGEAPREVGSGNHHFQGMLP